MSDLCKAIEDNNIDIIIHAAGLTNVEQCEKSPDLARLIHVEMSGNVAQACNILNIPLIAISTDHLFKGDQAFSEEWQMVQPLNVYSKTKADAEKIVLDLCPNALVVRTNFYGWGPSYRQSFSDWIITALRTKSQITLFDDVFFSPINASILAEICHELISKKAAGIFNIGLEGRISKYEFGMKLAEVFGLDQAFIRSGKFSTMSHLVSRPLDMSLNVSKLRLFLGFEMVGLEEQLRVLKYQEQYISAFKGSHHNV
jgi:dTDP-4-dehydrorhamnose reductase